MTALPLPPAPCARAAEQSLSHLPCALVQVTFPQACRPPSEERRATLQLQCPQRGPHRTAGLPPLHASLLRIPQPWVSSFLSPKPATPLQIVVRLKVIYEQSWAQRKSSGHYWHNWCLPKSPCVTGANSAPAPGSRRCIRDAVLIHKERPIVKATGLYRQQRAVERSQVGQDGEVMGSTS